ncbi:hypothetical protein [Pseudoalteromonas rubra]|uniref:DUF2190 domain-containing protein n=1 Tax=Pseudoalteromonas rubra TaxID=43658 RepID=A0A0U3IEV1_9GAMM|nr:hypothetical protein [Pseudoalteromonas rubra]ALU41932.1 hypothetical protein AT705_02700 [Pseudoalteromonas rubra]
MARPGLIKNYIADGALGKYRIAAVSTGADFTATQASGVSSPILGLTELGSDNEINRVDVTMTQTGEVTYGGDVMPGDPLVSDAEGRGIKLDMSLYAEDNEIWVLGTALESGKLGTVGSATISPYLIVK